MKKLVLLVVSLVVLVSCTQHKHSAELKSAEQKASYAIGQQVGRMLKSQGMELDSHILGESIGDVLSGKPSRLTDKEMQTAMSEMRKKAQEKRQATGKTNLEKAKQFLESNKSKKGIKVTKSGLQYEVLKAGKGKSPKADATVKVHYKGTLLDGSEFDSSYKRKEPAQFPVKGVIKGWTEALQLMKTGAKWKLYIHPDLAYGKFGRPGIPPNSLLTFEVELLEIK